MEKDEFLEYYSQGKNPFIKNRFIPYETIVGYLKSLPSSFKLSVEGYSVEQREIYSLTVGHGPKKVFMWSQMHGNESTTTKAVLDLLHGFIKSPSEEFIKTTLKQFTLKIIPVLNPDGLEAYTRVNANAVDLNRDAQDLSQPESKLLRRVFETFSPDFCFNLHDQRTIFSTGKQKLPASVSFLAPSYNRARSMNKSRLQAAQLIVEINNKLQDLIPGQVGKYDDAFNLNCVGDTFQLEGVPTVLFEAGHVQHDYHREETRKYIAYALFVALSTIHSGSFKTNTLEEYQAIPENRKLFYDVILRNVMVKGKRKDIAIQYVERLQNGKLHFVPILEKTGNLSSYYGHLEIEGNTKNIEINGANFLELNTEIQQLALNNEILSINLTNS